MTSLEDFIKTEYARMSWYEKTFMQYPELFSTRDLAANAKHFLVPTEKIIRPSWLNKIVILAFLSFIFIFWLLLLSMVVRSALLPLTLGGLLFVTFLMSILVWNGFLNKKYNYTIRLTKDNLQVDGQTLPWSVISDTQILFRHVGRGRNTYLVIATKDRVYKYSLFAFAISNERLSALIEAYKK